MPLILPALRAAYVFLNVWETFKTIKLPPGSARNGGQPSVRAMSQRKRAMKGCMTIWLVWCCFQIYEKTLDGVVGLLIPFYNELKSLVVLFFLLTRARGAEPVYLHVLRPLVKPYVTTLDALLDFSHSFGDFLLLLLSIPVNYVLSIFHRHPTAEHDDSAAVPGRDRLRRANGSTTASMHEDVRTRSRSRNAAHTNSGSNPTETEYGAVRSRRRPLEAARSRPTSGGQPTTQSGSHEIWHPPPSSYDTTPPNECDDPHGGHEPDIPVVDEWRKYEPFPSAYPPTPLPIRSKLPPTDGPTVAYPSLNGISEDSEDVPRVVEEWRKYEPFPAAYPPTPLPVSRALPGDRASNGIHMNGIAEGEEDEDEEPEDTRPDFRRSLQSLREDMDPTSAGDLSDDLDPMTGVQKTNGLHSDDEDMEVDRSSEEDDDDDEYVEEEDDFDVTLRTPYRPSRGQAVPKIVTSLISDTEAEDSPIIPSAGGLSTTDYGSPLRTRTNSAASSTLASSDSSSIAGRKRPFPSSDDAGVKPARGRGGPTRIPATTRASRLRAQNNSKDSTASLSEDSESGSSLKRRRVGSSAQTTTKRPGPPTRGDSTKTITGTEATTGTAAATRPIRNRPVKIPITAAPIEPTEATLRVAKQFAAAIQTESAATKPQVGPKRKRTVPTLAVPAPIRPKRTKSSGRDPD